LKLLILVIIMRKFCRVALFSLLLAPSLRGQVPKVTADLKPGTLKARGTLSGGPQQLSLNLTSTIKEENGAWVITDVTETLFGQSTDAATVEKGTLIVRKRVIHGEGEISYEVSGNKATGTMEVADRQIPISVTFDTPLFADGPSAAHSIALLPLAEGYTTTYYNLEVGSQRVLPVRLRVVASETVTVPAGTFDTFKVEYGAEGGTTQSTLWIAKELHKPVKAQSVLHNGASLTVELLQ
jgi:hypothetical protein